VRTPALPFEQALRSNMDSQSREKFLPKSIAAKRRRKKGSSTADTQSLNDDASQRDSIASRSNRGSDASSLNGSLKSNNTSSVTDGLGPEP